jgi:uncharacterized membrane protein YfcA
VDPTHLVLEILGGLVVGASLGLLGAGGAILSIPIFALVLGHSQGVAVVESLAVTGAVALVAGVRAAAAGRVDFRRAAALALPALAGAWIGGPVGRMLGELVQALLFASIAVVAAWRMLAPPPAPKDPESAPSARKVVFPAAIAGLSIGVLTSVIGVGGGFLLVPVLVLLLRVPMQRAVGTSLVVITTTTAVAIASKAVHLPDDFARASWQSVAIVAGCGIAGSLVGARYAARVPEKALRKVFAGVLVVVAIGVAVDAMRG